MKRTPAGEFVMTPTAERTLEKIRLVRDTGSVALFTGSAGVGKTTIVQRFLREDRDARYVVFSAASRNLSSVLKDIAKVLNINLTGRSTYELNKDIEHWLSWGSTDSGASLGFDSRKIYRGPYVVCDEVQNIDLNALRQLLHYNDMYGLPIIMIGNNHTINRTHANEAALDQIEDRIRFRDRIDRTRGDIGAVCDAWGIEDATVRDWVIAYAIETTWRRLFSLLRAAAELSADRQIGVSQLQDAIGFEGGIKAANEFLRKLTDRRRPLTISN